MMRMSFQSSEIRCEYAKKELLDVLQAITGAVPDSFNPAYGRILQIG